MHQIHRHYTQMRMIGEWEIRRKYGKVNLLNAIDCFYDQETQDKAISSLSVIFEFLHINHTEFDKVMLSFFVRKFHSLPCK